MLMSDENCPKFSLERYIQFNEQEVFVGEWTNN